MTVTATDSHGQSASDTFIVTVGNQLPTLTPAGPQVGQRRQPADDHEHRHDHRPGLSRTRQSRFASRRQRRVVPLLDQLGRRRRPPIRARPRSTTSAASWTSTDASFDGTHTYANDGTYTITLRVADDDMDAYTAAPLFESGTINEDYVQATIMVMVKPPSEENRDPQVFAAADQSDAGRRAGGFKRHEWRTSRWRPSQDPNDPNLHTATVNWGDGSGDRAGHRAWTSTPLTNTSVIVGSHYYADDGDVHRDGHRHRQPRPKRAAARSWSPSATSCPRSRRPVRK